MHYSPRMDFAIEAIRAAARQVRKFDLHRGMVKVIEKAPGDLVTTADLAAETVVLDMLAEHYPDEGILSEERGSSGDKTSCWVLDPIDGTTNFVHGFPEYAVSLAWCWDGEPQLGVIYDVCRDELYIAEKGKGALCNERRIRVSKTRRLDDALIASTGRAGTDSWRWSFLAEVSRQSAGFRRIGSATLDLALTARGALDATFGANLQYWDYAAGAVILREAGGTFFSDLDGNMEVDFGAQLGLCLYGSPRVTGALRRLANQWQTQSGG